LQQRHAGVHGETKKNPQSPRGATKEIGKATSSGEEEGYIPHDGAHTLANARMPASGGMEREATMRDVVGAVPCTRHGQRSSGAR